MIPRQSHANVQQRPPCLPLLLARGVPPRRGVEAVEVEDVAGSRRITEPLANVLHTVSTRRDRPAFRVRRQVKVAERDQVYRVHCWVLLPGSRRRPRRGP